MTGCRWSFQAKEREMSWGYQSFEYSSGGMLSVTRPNFDVFQPETDPVDLVRHSPGSVVLLYAECSGGFDELRVE